MTRRTKANSAPEPAAAGAAGVEPTAGPDFETAMQRLEAIVHELEGGQVPLEKAMQLFEEGLQLGATCRAQLDLAQARVERLLERPDGGADRQPFEPGP